MIVCARCGQENPEGFRFCGRCGSALADVREVRKTVTVVFCDLTGSTALGESLDPEAVRATMRRYFDELRAILERHGGTVEKFIGDAVMAVFGVPQAHEDDALRAVRAAVEMRAAVAALGLEARVGVNTGEVVAGNGDTLVTGDAVNVAARLEQTAEPGEILIGAETRRLVRDAVHVEPVELAVKGKRAPVEAYRLLDVDREAAAVARRLDSPLVARQRELDRLRHDFEATLAERSCHLFTLLGPAGVGKSRLAAEFLAGLDARVLRGRCLHYGEGISYWPLVEVLLQLGVDPEAVLGLPSPTEAAVASRKLFEAEAAQRPLVLVFDDLQWAEPTFLELVEHVVDWSRDAPIFLLCIARPELLDLRPMWGGGKPNTTTILLEPLAENDASTLIDNLLGGAELADDARSRIVEASEGNPLFVEEMLLMLREDGGGEVVVPPTIHALLQARLDHLASEERAVIERGSVEGNIFHRAPVAELAPSPVRTNLDDHLLQLVRKELIRPEPPTFPGDDAFRFRHLLIRDAAYESLPKETRAELHARFADWLDAHVDLVEQDEIVGYHLEQAVGYRRELGSGDEALAVRAAERLTAAGRSALGRRDLQAGVALLGRATALFERGHAARRSALPPLAGTLIGLGRLDEALTHIEELETSGDARSEAYAALIRPFHGVHSGRGSLEAARPALAAAKAVLERLGDDFGVARALVAEGGAEWMACRAAAAAKAYRAALPKAERAGDPALLQDVRAALITAYSHGPTPVEQAEQEIHGILDASRGLFTVESGAQRALGRLAAMRGDFETARELIRLGREPLAESGLVMFYAATSQGAASVEQMAGDFEAAERVLREGFDELSRLDEHAYASTIAVDIAYALCAARREQQSEQWIATARTLSPADDVATLARADTVEAVLRARGGEHEEADRLARKAVAVVERTDFWEMRGHAFEALAEVVAATGRRDEARAALETAVCIYEAKGVIVLAERARALLAEL